MNAQYPSPAMGGNPYQTFQGAGPANYGPPAYGASADPYGQQQKLLPYLPQGKTRQRKTTLNVIPIFLSLFAPWVVFCLISAMLSFSMHYRAAAVCYIIEVFAVVILGFIVVLSLYRMCQRWMYEEESQGGRREGDWTCFLATSTLVAVVLGIVFGNLQFWANMQPFYDVQSLNTYPAVDVTRMRGQELMDAGQVTFVPGTHLDISRSMGFKNERTYCVAPITGSFAVEGNPPLASYDFWAVGTDCCSSGAADFHCGEYSGGAHAGLRLMSDEERPFFRLAVQQAQSTYAIRATHPLFFHWVADPAAKSQESRLMTFRAYLIGMFVYFLFQLTLVATACWCFTNSGSIWN